MSASGFLFNTRCHTSLPDATAAYWAGIPGSTQAGSPSYATQVVFDGSQWLIKTFSISSGGYALQSSVVAPQPTFPTCDPMESFKDGMEIGGGVGLAILFAFLIRAMGWGTR